MTQPRIAVLGSRGRMGEWVTRLLQTEYAKQAVLSARVDQGDDLEAALEADAVIDFSTPIAVVALAKIALPRSQNLPAFVIGSTGWKPDERAVLDQLAQKAAVLTASNFSTGVAALIEILKNASPLLEKFGYTPVIVETHHRHKKDAPSGTALSLQRAVSTAGPGNVQTHSVRAGEVIGDHEVTFYGPGDHLTFGHFAQDRSIFARGAIDAAIWMAGRRTKPGMVGMDAFVKERLK